MTEQVYKGFLSPHTVKWVDMFSMRRARCAFFKGESRSISKKIANFFSGSNLKENDRKLLCAKCVEIFFYSSCTQTPKVVFYGTFMRKTSTFLCCYSVAPSGVEVFSYLSFSRPYSPTWGFLQWQICKFLRNMCQTNNLSGFSQVRYYKYTNSTININTMKPTPSLHQFFLQSQII